MLYASDMFQSQFTSVTDKTMFNSHGLSLALQTKNVNQVKGDDLSKIMNDLDEFNRSLKEEDHDSRSISEHLDFISEDNDLDEHENPCKKTKRYHRHTPQQIQELEALFKESPHPDEKQRTELSRRLSLKPRQVKFWFQNRRTQMKTQIERHENSFLKQENEKLRLENITIRNGMRNPICSNCGGPAVPRELSFEEQHLRIENARLKDELDRVCTLAGKFLGKSVSALAHRNTSLLPNSSLDLAIGGNGFGSVSDFVTGTSSSLSSVVTSNHVSAMSNFRGVDKPVLLDLALSAMDELVKMAQMGEPLWIQNFGSGKETLNYEEYLQVFPRCIGMKPAEFVYEATRETGMVIINSLELVDTLMDATPWVNMFTSMIARVTITDMISSGIAGTRNGALQLMHAEFRVLSPLVPTRDASFVRFCKQLAEGTWAVVDASINGEVNLSGNKSNNMKCRRLPSGFVVQDMPNGYSKITWVEHTEYDETTVHQLYRSMLRLGMGLGAQCWVASLQRHCECLALTSSLSIGSTAMTPSGRRNMLSLAQRMMANFCTGVCESSSRKWSKFSGYGNISEDVKVMTRQSLDDPGEPPGVVLSAATSVWLPVSPQRLFNFLRDASLRSEWDILSNGGPMQEMIHIAKGKDDGNAVSLLRAGAVSGNQGNNMLIFQETCTDTSGFLVVYAPVDIPAIHLVMNGGESAYVALLPSGFSILPDGATVGLQQQKLGGSLLTVAFQILASTLPSAKLTLESVETVNNLISRTIQKIKDALNTDH